MNYRQPNLANLAPSESEFHDKLQLLHARLTKCTDREPMTGIAVANALGSSRSMLNRWLRRQSSPIWLARKAALCILEELAK